MIVLFFIYTYQIMHIKQQNQVQGSQLKQARLKLSLGPLGIGIFRVGYFGTRDFSRTKAVLKILTSTPFKYNIESKNELSPRKPQC